MNSKKIPSKKEIKKAEQLSEDENSLLTSYFDIVYNDIKMPRMTVSQGANRLKLSCFNINGSEHPSKLEKNVIINSNNEYKIEYTVTCIQEVYKSTSILDAIEVMRKHLMEFVNIDIEKILKEYKLKQK